MLAEKEGQTTSAATEETEENQNNQTTDRRNMQEIVVIQDPNRIQQKRRPRNPTRLEPLVEQERAKMAKAAAKKKKNN